MKKIYLLFICFLFGTGIGFSQTMYYKLIRKVVNGVSLNEVSGGQFITFVKNKCYESDKWGYSVNNGVLVFHRLENGISKYIGDSYWGYSVFKFNLDKMFLNVETSDGNIYVYKHSAVPSDVTTSSLIKTSESINTNMELEATIERNIEVYDNYVTNSVTTNSSKVETHNSHEELCYNCGGKGYIEKVMYFGSSQGNKTVRIDCGMCVRGRITK